MYLQGLGCRSVFSFFISDKNLKRTEEILLQISPGTDTFPLKQSGLVARTETFEKGTDAILVNSVQGLKHILISGYWHIVTANHLVRWG